MANLVEKRSRGKAQYFIEDLGNDITLDMVLIRPGSFLMGAPEDEEGKSEESPQHLVTIPQFFMGKYPVTQVQWRTVAAMPEIDRKLAPNPSASKGDNRPVEGVSWYEAMEFCNRLSAYICNRLSAHTNRRYRLPSEAEWEYACRAGTTTPFHFGETITLTLANYHANSTYQNEPKRTNRQGTTPVGSFSVANRFGLFDMHGNVNEWCADHWHENYNGAPSDGSAWVTSDGSSSRVMRGGSWFLYPDECRSAHRKNHYDPNFQHSSVGFRVVCSLG